MNCKQGDLAIVVGGDVDGANMGRIVKCLRLSSLAHLNYRNEPVWFIDVELEWDGGKRNFSPDKFLRPIRDTDGQDEALTLVPHKETVKC